MNVRRWYINNDVGICEGRDGVLEDNHEPCGEERKKLGGTEGHAICSLLLGTLFVEVSNQLNAANADNVTTTEEGAEGGAMDGGGRRRRG